MAPPGTPAPGSATWPAAASLRPAHPTNYGAPSPHHGASRPVPSCQQPGGPQGAESSSMRDDSHPHPPPTPRRQRHLRGRGEARAEGHGDGGEPRAEVVGGVLERLAFVVGVAAKAEAAPCGPPSRPRAGESSRSPSPTVCCPAVAGETRRTEVRRRDTIHAQGVMRSAPRQAMVGGRLPAHRQAAAAREQAHGQVEAGAPRLRAAHRGRGRQPAITT